MAFKLENIEFEDTTDNSKSNSNQKIISEYNFGKTKGLSEDRTFCPDYGPDTCSCYNHCYCNSD